MNGNEVIRRLKAEGWQQVRVRGSHRLMEKNGKVVPVPVHGSKEIGKGCLPKSSGRQE
jgi:predicted RNA binding protein YcfA (HicA-like mRNA interferase family)